MEKELNKSKILHIPERRLLELKDLKEIKLE